MLYTDTEVQAFDEWLGIGQNVAKNVLDKIAPAIAARALREFRDSLHDRRDVFKVWADPRSAIRAVEIDLSATASEIEAGQS